MKLNQKGFSLIEIMAVLVISSVILVPLLISFTDSISINQQSQASRIAASVAEGSLNTLEKIDFTKYRTPLSDANTAGDYYIEIDADQCTTIFSTTTDQTICTAIFSTTSSNIAFNATTMKVYMFDFSLTSAEYSQLINNQSIEQAVRDELQSNQDIINQIDGNDNQDIIWAIIWLDYYDNPDRYLVSTGVIANGDT